MALNTSEMWFHCIKIAFVTKKLQKIAQQLVAFPPDLQSLRRLDPSVCDAFELH